MVVARMARKSKVIMEREVPSDIVELQTYLKSLKGTKILVVEETTTSQWLYTELRDYVNKIVICDPHRNRLLSEGPKADRIDARKLVQLLRAGLLKEVYHSGDIFLKLRRIVSGYDDLVKSGVRVKNQRYSLLKACGHSGYERTGFKIRYADEQFVLESLDRQIERYEEEKEAYEKEFGRLARKHPAIRHQRSLPGIGTINAVKIVARVVTPNRFPRKGHYLSYCGLIKLEKMSGGRSYGKKNPRYSRQLKSIYKTGILAAIGGDNPINDYYEYLIKEKGYPEYTARHKACRRLAVLSLGVFRSGGRYQFDREDHVKEGN
jgi:transposase